MPLGGFSLNLGQPSSSSPQSADLGKEATQPSWRALFGYDPSPALQYCEPVLRDGKLFVKISQAVRSQWLSGKTVS